MAEESEEIYGFCGWLVRKAIGSNEQMNDIRLLARFWDMILKTVKTVSD